VEHIAQPCTQNPKLFTAAMHCTARQKGIFWPLPHTNSKALSRIVPRGTHLDMVFQVGTDV
jgi:hypothetical protein